MTSSPGPEVTILLALHNGGDWVSGQLASIAAQRGIRWRLVVSDDGSADCGPQVVAEFAARHPPEQVMLAAGPGRGAARNFLHLLSATGRETGFAAFCDQDDVWLPGKLARAVAWLSALPDTHPVLYCGRTAICDRSLRVTGLSPLFRARPSFPNALVQSIAGGNTMVMNRAALALARAALREAPGVVAHDWWLYQIVAGAGGTVLYDAEPQVLYRQHGGNLVGSNASLAARARRLGMVAAGRFRDWNAANIAALRASAHRLTPENRALLERFAEARDLPALPRLRALRGLGLYRQTLCGTVSYWGAAAARLV